jgi:hypothetical protein
MSMTPQQLQTNSRKNLQTVHEKQSWLTIACFVDDTGQVHMARVTNNFPIGKIMQVIEKITTDLVKEVK